MSAEFCCGETSPLLRPAVLHRSDLKDAGIPVKDREGRVIDFHGQRTTFITNLSRVGISPALAQKIARHSDINLTMGTYTQLEMAELGQAVERLPSLTSMESAHNVEGSEKVRKQQLAALNAAWHQLSDEVRSAIMKLIG